jgi:hypothetical protein
VQYLKEENGRYVFRSSRSSRTGRVFSVAMIMSAAFTVVILLVLYLMLDRESMGQNAYIIPVVLVVVLPVDIALILVLRKRFSTAGMVSVDYMNGSISFGRSELGIGSIRHLELRSGQSAVPGVLLGGAGYAVVAVTEDDSLVMTRIADREEARAVAEELSSVLSVRLKDQT